MSTRAQRLCLIVLMSVVMAVPVEGERRKGAAASTEPGSYKEWGPNIDELEIVKTFDFGDYDQVVVVPLEADDVKLPEEKDNSYKPVLKVLESATETMVEGMRPKVTKISIDSKPGKGAKTLIVRGKILSMEPGSRAGRYFAGAYGGGAAKTKIEGEIVDAKSKQVLARFTQERRSSFSMRGGGSYETMLNRNLKAIGEDIANLLNEF